MTTIELCKIELKQRKRDKRLYYKVSAPHGVYLYDTIEELLKELQPIVKFVDGCIAIDLSKGR